MVSLELDVASKLLKYCLRILYEELAIPTVIPESSNGDGIGLRIHITVINSKASSTTIIN